jgi:hypothetical protein
LPKIIKNKVKNIRVKKNIYFSLPDDFDPADYGFACPIGLENCGQLNEIMKQSTKKNVFVAIPYSDYEYEDQIVNLVKVAGLEPKLAKQRIETKIILCKICREIRKSDYGIVDISNNNANVAYELGLMQSLGRCCAILLKEGNKPQSDLQGLEAVLYKNSDFEKKLGQWLANNVREVDTKALEKFCLTKTKVY